MGKDTEIKQELAKIRSVLDRLQQLPREQNHEHGSVGLDELGIDEPGDPAKDIWGEQASLSSFSSQRKRAAPLPEPRPIAVQVLADIPRAASTATAAGRSRLPGIAATLLAGSALLAMAGFIATSYRSAQRETTLEAVPLVQTAAALTAVAASSGDHVAGAPVPGTHSELRQAAPAAVLLPQPERPSDTDAATATAAPAAGPSQPPAQPQALPEAAPSRGPSASARPVPNVNDTILLKPTPSQPAEPESGRDGSQRTPAAKSALKHARAQLPAAPCLDLTVTIEPRSAGMTAIVVKSLCRAEQTVDLRYGSFTTQAALDTDGAVTVAIDLYAGPSESISVTFMDGVRRILAPKTLESDRVYKLAVLWPATVQLRLHAFESPAGTTGNTHVWADDAEAKSGTDTANRRRSLGSMTTASQDSQIAARMEVYTLVQPKDGTGGFVSFMLGYDQRSEHHAGMPCTAGRTDAVDFDYVVLEPQDRMTAGKGTLPSQACTSGQNSEPLLLGVGLPVIRFPAG